MSIDYSLELATDTPVAEVAAALRRVDGVVLEHGPWIRVLEPSVAPWHVVVTDLGITPTVRIAFRLLKNSTAADSVGLGGQEDVIVRLAVGVLDVVPGDAVLHRECESIWLLRLGGELSLHESDGIWSPERLAIVGSRVYRRSTRTFAD